MKLTKVEGQVKAKRNVKTKMVKSKNIEETRMIRGITKPYGEKIGAAEPVRCQKCGKPIGYVTVVSRGFTPFQQPIPKVKIVAICMECAQKKK
jgi:hypothetical protein